MTLFLSGRVAVASRQRVHRRERSALHAEGGEIALSSSGMKERQEAIELVLKKG